MTAFSQGDIVLVDFAPTRDHEPQHKRPALVVSNNDFNLSTSMTIVCPITSTENSFFLHEPLPLGLKVKGSVVMEQARAIDLTARDAQLLDTLGTEHLEPLLICLRTFF